MVVAVPLDKINKAIVEIESCRAYDTPELKSTKDNWLGILYDARDRYESLEEQNFITINLLLCYHYLNYCNLMFRKEITGAITTMVKTSKTIIENKFNTDSNTDNEAK